MSFLRGHWQLIAIVMAVFALWQTPVLVPLKILVVFLHELSHALATVLTGGEVISLSVSANQGGEVWSRGGSRFLILSAGYLGSLVIGLLILLTALRTHLDRHLMAFLGAAMGVVTLLYVRDLFAILFCLAAAAAMLAAARYLSVAANDLILRTIGLTSMVYVPYDIFSDTILRPELQSDARMLADEFGGATVLWGAIWLAISLVVIAAALRHFLGQSSNLGAAAD